VVVDTGVLVSAFAFGGTPERVLRRLLGGCEIYVSLQILQEYRQVPQQLLAERKITRSQLEALVSGIASFVGDARLVVAKSKLRLCRDPEDDVLLECSLAADADFLVTGDRDLLEIERAALRAAGLVRLQIVTPAAVLRRIP
jgi:putative PIN family toxin of toxin-antitoxin system